MYTYPKYSKTFHPIKHLTLEDRQLIASELNNGSSFKQIARMLGKDCTTISKEVRKNYSLSQTGCFGHCYNNCRYSFTCSKASICAECKNPRSKKRCRFCNFCNDNCDSYRPSVCHELEKPPYVCNACKKRASHCTLEKKLYRALPAENKYKSILSEARTGISLSESDILFLDELISPLLKRGQSIHHIYLHHKDEIMVSESTIYKLVDAGFFSARNIDLPRKVRFAPRRKRPEFKVEKTCRIGRSYTDFERYFKEHPDLPLVEIDSVVGAKGGKVLLTIHFLNTECMLAFIRDRNDARSVIDIFNRLYETLPTGSFSSIFPLLLGDNGSEFSNPSALEKAPDGTIRTRLFYCDPSAPYQKGSAERNHEFIRRFVPKGSSFDSLSQDDIQLMMNHINSYARPSLCDRTPYEMMEFLYGKEVCDCFGLVLIPADEVTLNKTIFEKGGTTANET